jgi:transcriptional regulator with XRE-family HTH domain
VTSGHTGPQRLAAVLRALRLEHGLSTRALARRTACARSTIQRLERAAMRPRYSLLASIATAMNPDDPQGIREQLLAAAGESVALDADGTRRWRRRRMERGILRGEVPMPKKLAQAFELHAAADPLWRREMALLDAPGAFNDAAALSEAHRLSEERRELRELAGPPIVFHVGRHVIRAGWDCP